MPLYIKRVQIEEGFLDGLDTYFEPGLNVVIGARGTGKTSLIELIRYALGVSGFTTESTKKATEHATSVLGSGQITVTLQDGNTQIIVSRTATDKSPRTTAPFLPPLVFSQTEIETVGLHASGRLRLIDSFLKKIESSKQAENEQIAKIKKLTVDVETTSREIIQLQEQTKHLPQLAQMLKEVSVKEREFAKSSASVALKQQALGRLASQTASSAVAQASIERFQNSIRAWSTQIQQLQQSSPTTETWQNPNSDDPLSGLRPKLTAIIDKIVGTQSEFYQLYTEAAKVLEGVIEKRVAFDEQARQLRREIETIKEGAGAVARQSSSLKEQQAQLNSLRDLLSDKSIHFAQLRELRNNHLDILETLREEKFQDRQNVSQILNKELGPRIRVEVQRAGQIDGYFQVILAALRGSGLRYNDIALQLSESVSPRELLEAAENNDYASIADITNMTKDRAARVLAQFRERSMGDLATCLIEDNVVMKLLDGQDFKDISELSTGQRCTVILPILLNHRGKVLIVDQPEDHIDNAFIAETVIKAVGNRSKDTQMIFSTHNANIPVLGNAEIVTQMGSDGKRGFVVLRDNLQAQPVVGAITGMEGGKEAFDRRAAFYSRHTS
ncbi:AAA family ATPase [Methylobacterium sp. J-076]|uniref:AAA family ATPase n=1 Tax=Methylobacterium sp. J-076 TaxID=2836655 RepID=UPI001FBB8FBC|nr:AAA family ATPase [Methylobacterium sp. J-076]